MPRLDPKSITWKSLEVGPGRIFEKLPQVIQFRARLENQWATQSSAYQIYMLINYVWACYTEDSDSTDLKWWPETFRTSSQVVLMLLLLSHTLTGEELEKNPRFFVCTGCSIICLCSGLAVLALPENWLEMQILGPYLRFIKSEILGAEPSNKSF